MVCLSASSPERDFLACYFLSECDRASTYLKEVLLFCSFHNSTFYWRAIASEIIALSKIAITLSRTCIHSMKFSLPKKFKTLYISNIQRKSLYNPYTPKTTYLDFVICSDAISSTLETLRKPLEAARCTS